MLRRSRSTRWGRLVQRDLLVFSGVPPPIWLRWLILSKELARRHPGFDGYRSGRADRGTHNPNAIWAIARKRKFNPGVPFGDGFFAFLHLNKEGFVPACDKYADTCNPDLSLAWPNERPAGIYTWAALAPGMLAGGISLVLQQLESPLYAGVDIYSRPNTAQGLHFNETLGLKKGAKIGAIYAPQPPHLPALRPGGPTLRHLSSQWARAR